MDINSETGEVSGEVQLPPEEPEATRVEVMSRVLGRLAHVTEPTTIEFSGRTFTRGMMRGLIGR